MGKLDGKVVVVTGAGGGIGQAVCHRFASEGARVVAADRSLASVTPVAKAIGPSATAVALDVASEASIRQAVAEIERTFGGIDALVNNAGVFEMQPLLDIDGDSFDRLYAVNVKGTLFVLQAVARAMVAAGRPGAIVNMASQAGRQGEPHSAAYAASKAAVISLTRSAALALVDRGIRVNAIAPGVIDTPMWDHVDALYAKLEGIPAGEKKRQVTAAIPMKRMGQPDDVATVAVFLASDDSRYLVGQTINADGGNIMS